MSLLATSRLILRAFQPADAPRLAELINDFDISRMLSTVPYPYPPDAAREFIAKIQPEQETYAICLASGPLIGDISFQPEKRDMQFGYWLGKAFWGKGYMSEATSALLHRVFSELGVDKVETSVFADNPTSWKLQQKLGFRRTGEKSFYSLARNAEVSSWKTELTREDFLKS
jgi:RimJ/RimL family protein N-acetyltransferase